MHSTKSEFLPPSSHQPSFPTNKPSSITTFMSSASSWNMQVKTLIFRWRRSSSSCQPTQKRKENVFVKINLECRQEYSHWTLEPTFQSYHAQRSQICQCLQNIRRIQIGRSQCVESYSWELGIHTNRDSILCQS